MKEKLLIIILILFSFFDAANSKIVNNNYYDYELDIDEQCSVNYLDEDKSTVAITSPDGMSTFYIVCFKTGNWETVYNNDVLENLDRNVFDDLTMAPDKTDSYFWFSKEDRFYSYDDGTLCKTRVLLWNDKAGLLAGFSRDGNMNFIEKCMDDFQSPITLGKIATAIYILVFICIIGVGFVLWEEQRFFAILYILVVIAGWYYFHWVLNYSVNRYILSLFG